MDYEDFKRELADAARELDRTTVCEISHSCGQLVIDGLTCSHNYDGVLRIYFDKPQDSPQQRSEPDMILRQTDLGWQDARLAEDGFGVISSARLAKLCVMRLGELAFELVYSGKPADTKFGII